MHPAALKLSAHLMAAFFSKVCCCYGVAQDFAREHSIRVHLQNILGADAEREEGLRRVVGTGYTVRTKPASELSEAAAEAIEEAVDAILLIEQGETCFLDATRPCDEKNVASCAQPEKSRSMEHEPAPQWKPLQCAGDDVSVHGSTRTCDQRCEEPSTADDSTSKDVCSVAQAAPKETALPQVHEFEANLCGEKLGLGVRMVPDVGALLVEVVQTEGAAAEWNRAHPEQAILKGDHIIEVNDKVGSPPHMVVECSKSKSAILKLRRA